LTDIGASVGALERDEWLRAAWRVMVAAQVDPERLMFVDEMGTNTSLSPVYAWVPKGQRAYCSVPRNRGKYTTLLSIMSLCVMGPSLAVDGPIDREVFEAYVERVLAPTLRVGQVVVMDNLSAHKGERVRKLIEHRGCELLYLPPYSPDLKWDEKAEIMLRREPTMVSLENRSRSQADPQEGGLRPCPSTTRPSTAH
jgi:hypothetical protein